MSRRPAGPTVGGSLINEQPAAHRARRIAIIGSTGSGKTTLAQQLAALLGVQHEYRRRKRPAIPMELGRSEHSHLTVYRPRSPREVKRWLASIRRV